MCGAGCYKSNWQRLLIDVQLHIQLWSNHCEQPYKGVAEQICHVETVSSLRLAEKVINTRVAIKVGTSYGSVSKLQTLGMYIVILLNGKSLEESIRL